MWVEAVQPKVESAYTKYVSLKGSWDKKCISYAPWSIGNIFLS